MTQVQDYTPFQFKLLTRLFPRAKWTVLGDPNQAIWGKSIDISLDIPSITQMDPADVLVYHLQRSYRSTMEIVQFAQSIVPKGHVIIPFERHGEQPHVNVVADEQQLHQHIIKTIERWRSEGMQTIAVLCKTDAETTKVYEYLQAIPDLQRIHKDVQHYTEGVLLIPIYLAKGLEFDAVIVYDASESKYLTEQDRLILYTAATRAMHRLEITAIGRPSKFLTKEK